MRDFFFVIKMALITLFIIMVMQIQVNNQTLEERSLAAIRTSPYIEELQKVADGGVIFAKRVWGTIAGYFNDEIFKGFKSDKRPGDRVRSGIDRSKSYFEEKAKEAQAKLKELQDEHTRRTQKN